MNTEQAIPEPRTESIKKNQTGCLYQFYGNWEREKAMRNDCETCVNYVYDEDSESYYCDVNLDEDEYYRFISTEYKECPYYRNGDEYRVVRHQM